MNGLGPRKRLTEPSTGIEVELNTNRGDLLIRVFWEHGKDCMIDVTKYDFIKHSHEDRQPDSFADSTKKVEIRNTLSRYPLFVKKNLVQISHA